MASAAPVGRGVVEHWCVRRALGSRLELQSVAYRVDPDLGAGFVRVAARAAGYSDRSDQRSAGFDLQTAAENHHTGKVADTGLHHAGLADRVEFGRAGGEWRRGPCLD